MDAPSKPAAAPGAQIYPSPGPVAGGSDSPFDKVNDSSPVVYFLIGLVSALFLGPFSLIFLCCPPFADGENPRAVKWFLGGFFASFVVAIVIVIVYVMLFVVASTELASSVSNTPIST